MDYNINNNDHNTDTQQLQPQKTFHLSKKIILIGVITLCVLAGIIILCLRLTSNPKKKVMQAISNTLSTRDTTVEEYLHTDDFRKLIATGAFQTNATLNLDDLKFDSDYKDMEKLVTLAPRISMESKINYPDKKLLSNITLGVGGSNLLDYKVYANDTIVSMECPTLYDGALSVDTTNLASDYNSSALSTVLQTPMLDDTVNFNLFDHPLSQQTFLEKYKASYEEDLTAFYDAVTVKEVSGQEFSIQDQTIHGKAYALSLPGSMLETLYKNALKTLSDDSDSLYQELSYLAEQQIGTVHFPDTVKCIIYVDPATNQMIAFSHEDTYTYQSETYDTKLQINWNNLDKPMNDVTAILTASNSKEKTATFTLSSSTTTEENRTKNEFKCLLDASDIDARNGNLEFLFQYELAKDTGNYSIDSSMSTNDHTDTLYTVSSNGCFTRIDAGKDISLAIDSLAIAIPGNGISLEFSGDYSLRTCTASIETPEKLRPILEMDEDSLYALFYEVLRNAGQSPILKYL